MGGSAPLSCQSGYGTPRGDFRHLDLRHLDRIATSACDTLSMGYVLHGLSPEFRRFVLLGRARRACYGAGSLREPENGGRR